MHNDLVELGWSENQWSRIVSTVTDEVQRARVAAQLLPVFGPLDPTAVSFADFNLVPGVNPNAPPPNRLETNNVPDHALTTIAVPVQLSSSEVADDDLQGALVKFRRAANIVARLEDAVLFNDRPVANRPLLGVGGIPLVDRVTGGGPRRGQNYELGLLPFDLGFVRSPLGGRLAVGVNPPFPPLPNARVGLRVTNAIVRALSQLDNAGHGGPYACALCPYFYEAVYAPTGALLMAKDRILPLLNGPLIRSSAITNLPNPYGVVVALGGGQVGLRVTSDISVRYLQVTNEPRYLFRVSERLGLRVSDPSAIAVLN